MHLNSICINRSIGAGGGDNHESGIQLRFPAHFSHYKTTSMSKDAKHYLRDSVVY